MEFVNVHLTFEPLDPKQKIFHEGQHLIEFSYKIQNQILWLLLEKLLHQVIRLHMYNSQSPRSVQEWLYGKLLISEIRMDEFIELIKEYNWETLGLFV